MPAPSPWPPDERLPAAALRVEEKLQRVTVATVYRCLVGDKADAQAAEPGERLALQDVQAREDRRG